MMIKDFEDNILTFEQVMLDTSNSDSNHVLKIILKREIGLDVDGEVLYKDVQGIRIELDGRTLEIPMEVAFLFIDTISSIHSGPDEFAEVIEDEDEDEEEIEFSPALTNLLKTLNPDFFMDRFNYNKDI